MESLSTRDTAALLEAIRSVSELGDLDAYARRVVAEMSVLVPSDYVSYNEVDPPRVAVVMEPHPLTPTQEEAFGRYVHEHPLVAHYRRTDDGSPIKISDFLTRRELHRLNLYEHLFRELGVEYQMSVGLPAPRPIVIGIALSRGGRTDYSERDRTVLQLVRPHLVQAYRNAQLHTALRGSLEAVTGALAAEGRSVLLVDDAGRVEPLGAGAAATLCRFFPPARGHDVAETVLDWLRAQRRRLGRRDSLPPLARPLVAESDGRRLILRYVPGDGEDVILCDERSLEPDATPLRALGLSDREAEVLLAAARGATNDEIARRLGISLGTVKKHLGNVYRKLGVRSRAAAAAHAFETMALVPAAD